MTEPAAISILPLTAADYPEMLGLWQKSAGVGLSGADTAENIARFLSRNPGLSFLARSGSELAGTILAGHDGRRGYIYHLAVDERYRHRGIATSLVERSLAALSRSSIDKCHIMVFADNDAGSAFWQKMGWTRRDDIAVFSINLDRR